MVNGDGGRSSWKVWDSYVHIAISKMDKNLGPIV